MTLRNLMTSLLALTLMVCVGGCDSDTDETSNLAVFDLSPYCGEGTELNEAETLCVAICGEGTELNSDGSQCVPSGVTDYCGEGTELNADGTQCVPVYVYDCFRGGLCSQAHAKGYFTEAEGNIYAGDTKGSTGCDATKELAAEWSAAAFTYGYASPLLPHFDFFTLPPLMCR